MSAHSAPVRWGILGTATIARKNWKAIRRSANATLTAVASRDTERAAKYIHECQSEVPFPTAPAACGTYEELLRRPDVDAVYIPLPTGIRREWVVRAAEAGKHVLCEKPCAPNVADLKAMLDACRANKVQFMDGVMFMHSQRLPLLRQILDDGLSVGEIRRIATNFTFAAPDEFLRGNIRVHGDLEPLGCLGDLGWYNIRFALWAMKYQRPQRVSGRLLASHGTVGKPVPTEFSGELLFAGGVTASFYCSFTTEIQQWGHISGSKGSVHLSDFVLPFYGCETTFEVNQPTYRVEGCEFQMQSHARKFAVREYSEGVLGAQEVTMIRTFSDLVASGNVDPKWGDIALQTQEVMEACLRSAHDDGRAVSMG